MVRNDPGSQETYKQSSCRALEWIPHLRAPFPSLRLPCFLEADSHEMLTSPYKIPCRRFQIESCQRRFHTSNPLFNFAKNGPLHKGSSSSAIRTSARAPSPAVAFPPSQGALLLTVSVQLIPCASLHLHPLAYLPKTSPLTSGTNIGLTSHLEQSSALHFIPPLPRGDRALR